ncbi:short chain dehydrogenase [Caballeronia calidae]|uniref:Short chain dehydrogenase n=1 Tax=Caballeronia calidae TaxID=1777139 RepID=A0A158DUT7_9BURK|nr:hypothetical protein [Caballeronia calidae]SAK98381.1 short chain dehydrogenase [Caballeronia calidae]
MERLKGKVAIIIGAGQSPGEAMGIGRATTISFLREGAAVLAVDRNVSGAQESVAQGGRMLMLMSSRPMSRTHRVLLRLWTQQ